MSWDKFKESGSIEKNDNPSTNDWIGDIDTDFIDFKIAEFEKLQAESKNGRSAEKEIAVIENQFDRYSDADIESLDKNTIDIDFLPKVKNQDGSLSTERKYKYSPFVSQEDSDGDFIPDGWKPIILENGTKIYQLGKENSPSEYFTDSATVESCRDPNAGEIDLSKLKEKLQIKDDENAKNTLRVYKVDAPDGIKVAEGFTLENRQYGEGGSRQYFISPNNRKLIEILDD